MTDYYFRRSGNDIGPRRQAVSQFGNESPDFFGSARRVTANAGFVTVPPRAFLIWLFLRETAGTGVSVGVGTTLTGTDVLATVNGVVTANGTLTVDITEFSMGSFPAIAFQPLFLTFVGAAGYSIDADLVWKIGP